MTWRNYSGTIDVPARSSEDDQWLTIGKKIEAISGVKALWLQFEGSEEDENFSLDWVRFAGEADRSGGGG